MEMSAKDDEVDDGYGIESEEYDPCEYEWIKLMRAQIRNFLKCLIAYLKV